ncbi:uncharacterized protein [Diadema setosum]|uniref:uncharacterized protein n=1 Tax=Diadema setosum TaxID=31175 RepID=UPI003B3B7C2E
MPVLLRQLQVLMEAVIRLHKQQQESEGALQKQRQIIRHYQRAFLIAKKGGPLSMRNNGSNEQSASSSSDSSTSPDIHAGPASSMHRADLLKRPLQGTRSAPQLSDFTRLEECSMLKRRRMSMEANAPGIPSHPPQVSTQCSLSAQDARRVVMSAGRAPYLPGDREIFPQPRLGHRPPDDRMFHQVPPCPPEMHQDGPPPLPPHALIRRPAFEHGQEKRLPQHIKDNSFQPRRSHPQVEDGSDQAASRATARQSNESNQFSDDKSTNRGGQREPSMQVVPLRQQAPRYCHPEIRNSDSSAVDRRHAPVGQDQSFEWISRSNGRLHPDLLRLRANRCIIDYYHGISGEGQPPFGRGNYQEFQSSPPTVFPPNRGEMQLLATSASPTLRIMDAVTHSQEVREFLRLCQLASKEQCPKGLRSLCQEAFRQQWLP